MNSDDFEQPNLFSQPEPPPDQIVCCPTCHGRGTVLVDLSGPVGANHPSTSRKARTVSARIRWNSQRRQVLEHLERFGPSTAAEVQPSLGPLVSRNQTAIRLGECRKLGHVAYALDDHGQRIERTTSEGATGLVQIITAAGRAALAEALASQR